MASPTAAPGQYPEQLVIMVTSETKARIVSDAKRHRLSKSEVARTYLDAGIAEADSLAAAEQAGADDAKLTRLASAD